MTEEASGTQVATESSAEQGAQAAETTETFTYIDADGKFLPGWKERFVEERLRANKVYDSFTDIGGCLNMLGNLQTMIGRKGVVVPGEASPPSEWDAFHRALGRPDAKDQYQMSVPDDLMEHVETDMLSQAKEMFWKMGLNQRQVDTLWAFETERLGKALEGIRQQEIAAKEEADKTLTKLWGAARDSNLHLVNKLIAENVDDEEHKDELIGALGNSSALARLLANIAPKFMEHRVITGGEQPYNMTPAQAITEARKIEQTPGFLLPDGKGQFLRETNRPEYDRLEKERDKYYRIASGSQQKSG